MEREEILRLIQQANHKVIWTPKRIYLEFNQRQFEALLEGYQPHWDMRYGITFSEGYFYNHRSGVIVNKFRVEKSESGVYSIAEMFDNPEKCDWKVVFDSLLEACRQNDVRIDRDRHQEMFKITNDMQIE